MSDGWTQSEAIAFCRRIEEIVPAFGCHVALTGGLLYKLGERKDLDLIFYRIRQVARIDVDDMFDALKREFGVERVTHGEKWCIKATCRGRKLDCLFPECPVGDYSAKRTPTDVLFEMLSPKTTS